MKNTKILKFNGYEIIIFIESAEIFLRHSSLPNIWIRLNITGGTKDILIQLAVLLDEKDLQEFIKPLSKVDNFSEQISAATAKLTGIMTCCKHFKK